MAKITAFGVKNDNIRDYLSGKLSPDDREMLPVGAIPTFPLGGSEVDAASEIDDFERGVHGALYGKYPSLVILNRNLVIQLIRRILRTVSW